MASFVGFEVTYHVERKNIFPLNISDAYKMVLKSDTKSFTNSYRYWHHCHDKLNVGGFCEPSFRCHDKLNVGGFGEPFFRCFDKRAVSPRITRYRKKPEYERFSNTELDPLQRYECHRYEFHIMTKSELFFNGWFFEDDEDNEMGTLLGWIMDFVPRPAALILFQLQSNEPS